MFSYISRVINNILSGSLMPLNLVNFVELAIIGLVIFAFYKRYIQGTQYERLLKGIVMLLIALLLSKFLILLKLQILGKFLESLVFILLLGLVVVFQPELRRFLGYLGQPGFLSKNFLTNDPEDTKDVIDELTEAIKYLSKSKTGALIVIQNSPDNANYFEVGTKLNAKVSTELLLTIFHTNTPLHDGAVVINGATILSASVLLPLTEDPKLSWQYGTRHRAAIGMSEISDAICIVVSEETGEVSITQAGTLKKCESLDEFRFELEKIYGITEIKNAKNNKFKLNNIFFNDMKKFQGLLNKDSTNSSK